MNSKSNNEDIRALSYFIHKSSKSSYPDLKIISLLSADLIYKTNPLRSMPIPEIKIFIASQSILDKERDFIEQFIRESNDQNIRNDFYLRPERWEKHDSGLSVRRKQEDFTDILKECDILILILQGTLGFFSKEEFMTAYNLMTSGKKPNRIYVFDKNIPRTIDDVNALSAYLDLKALLYKDQQLMVDFEDFRILENELRKMVNYISTNRHKFI